MRTTIVFLAALVLLAVAAQPLIAEESPLEVARKAFADGKYAAAVEAAARVPEKSADHAKASYVTGEALLLLGKAPEAVKAFDVVVKLRPKAVPAWVGLARARTRTGEYEAAGKAADQALQLDKKSTDAWRVLGELHVARDELDDARKALAKAVSYGPKDPAAARSLVVVLLAADDGKAAEAAAKQFAARSKKHPMGPFLMGLALEHRKKHENAIAAYERAVQLDDTFIDAHKNLAILCHTMSSSYRNRERVKKAMHHYERYFALGGKDKKLEETYRTVKAVLEKYFPQGK